jgi:cell division protein FtsQ
MKGIKVKTPFFRGSRHRLGVSLESVVRRQQRRGRSFRLLTSFFVILGLFATFAVTVAIGLTWLSKITVFENEKYKLIHIDVETTGGLRREKVLEWAEIPSNANLMALDIRAVRQRLLSQSEIGEAQISKILPNRLVIKVTERRPIARVVTNVIVGQGRALVYALDRNGVVIAPRPGEDFMRLPEIIGANLLEIIPGQRVTSQSVLAAIDLILLLEASRLRPKLGRPRVDISLEKTLRLSTPGGGWVILSCEQDLLEQQIERLAKIMEHASKRAMRIQSADLTVARNVPVVLVNN